MVFVQGQRLWIPHANYDWRPANVLSVQSERRTLILQWMDNGEQEICDIEVLSGRDLIFECGYGSTDQADLSSLDIINEPEVLHALRHRFNDLKDIYTYCGTLLIAMNPYKELPIYGVDYMSAYNQNSIDTENKRDPHVFAIADEALSRLRLLHQNQSIIISGESGAGKTVSARHVLQYLATVTSTKGCLTSTLNRKNSLSSMPHRVLASTPLLESFGNASTTRNDNSSRFGKFLEVRFSRPPPLHFVEGCIRTYLLEKSRVVVQNENERNYHIFYQLLAAIRDAASTQAHHFLGDLGIDPSTTYHYARWTQIEPEDLEGFEGTVKSFQDLGFSSTEVNGVFAILGVILHLGNVSYTEAPQESSQITEAGEKSLSEVFRLLQCTEQGDSKGSWLSHRIIHTTDGELRKPLSPFEVHSARDALAKLIYQLLFQWIVARCNDALNTQSEDATKGNFIGILDIYGFENMASNSFEQFCINYANEKLQQRFIENVFRMEQEEYAREGLEWSFVEYYDNKSCIELLEGALGLINLLNDECKLLKPSDQNWLNRIRSEHLGQSVDFTQTKLWARERFVVQHFSEKVEYTVHGFTEKNLDRVIPEHVKVLAQTKNSVLGDMFKSCKELQCLGNERGGIITKPTVVTQFSQSLKDLMEILRQTTSHYIRCIKPNDQKASFTFNPERVMQQLRACGALQTIKIAAAGFPSRWTYTDFLNCYWQLSPLKTQLTDDPRKKVEIILKDTVQDPEKYRLGYTKVFFGNGVLAYLERARIARITAAATCIQKNLRRYLAERYYHRIREHILKIQAVSRHWLALRSIDERMHQKAIQNGSTKAEAEKVERSNRTLSLFRVLRNNSAASRNTGKDQSSTLKREIECLKEKLVAKENEIAARDEQISRLMKQNKEGGASKETRKRSMFRGNGKKQQAAVDNGFDDYEEVSNHLNRGFRRKLQSTSPNNGNLPEPISLSPEQEFENSETAVVNVVLDLQQRCALLDVEKEELYRCLETYQQNYAAAQARELEALRSIRRLEEILERSSQQKTDITSSNKESQVDTSDLGNLERMLETQRESSRRLQREVDYLNAEKSQLQSKLKEQSETIVMLQQRDSPQSGTNLSTRSDLGKQAMRLAKENTQLREKLATTASLNRRLTQAIKYFAELVHQRAPECLPMTTSPQLLDVRQLIAVAQGGAELNGSRDANHMPRFIRCVAGKEEDLIHLLVKNLDVEKAKSWSPLTAAELIFLLVRGADFDHDEAQISHLLSTSVQSIISVLNSSSSSVEVVIFWLINVFGLRNFVQQFGGDNTECPAVANTHFELENYNITLYIPVLNDVIAVAFQVLMGQVSEVLFPSALIIGAILEYEPVASLSSRALLPLSTGGLRPQNTWLQRKPHFNRLMNNLDSIYKCMKDFGATLVILSHTFYRVFFHICASALNAILIRKDLCTWARGAQIRHNLASLETWLSDNDLLPEEHSDAYQCGRSLMDHLLPLIQVCYILQSTKGGTNKTKISGLCQMCPNLTSSQIIRLLSRCMPMNGLKGGAPEEEFLVAVKRRLREERSQKTHKTVCCGVELSESTLLLDSDHWSTANEVLPFTPVPNSLADFQIPGELEDLSEFVITSNKLQTQP